MSTFPNVPGLDGRGMPAGRPLRADEISPREAAAAMREDELLLVDVREDDELRSAAVDGALHVRMRDVPARLPEIRERAGDRRVAFLCHGGVRSLRVTEHARANGLPEAVSVAGGIDLWAMTVDPGVPRY